MQKPFLAVVDPAVHTPELECFNRIALESSLPVAYSLPAMAGVDTLPVKVPAGIVILGSASSVNDRLPWQEALEKWILPLVKKGIPTLGLCYGHQMIAHLFGGRVEFRFPDQRKTLGFEQVALMQDKLWGGAQTGPLFVSHREVVTQAPKGFHPTASRADLVLDGLAHESLPLWTFQAHPEATGAFLRHREIAVPSGNAFAFGHSLVKAFLDYVGKRVSGEANLIG